MKPFTADAQVSSEVKYKDIFDIVNDAIFIHDPDTGVILEVNRKAIELCGYTDDEIRTKAVGDLSSGIPPHTQEDALEKIRAAKRQGGLVFEWHFRDKSGRLFWAEVNLKSAVIGGTRVMIALVREITERKRSEEKLRESEERFRTMADNISQLAWMADETGRIFWYNKRWLDYTGTTLDEMQGLGGRKVLHPDHARRVMDGISRCFETGEPWEDTFPLQGTNGGYRWFLSRAIPVRDSKSRVVRWFGTNTDITELKQAEEEVLMLNAELEQRVNERTRALVQTVDKLEKQREVLQTVFDNIPVMLVLFDAHGSVQMVNREFEKLLGWSLDQVRGTDLLAAAYPDPYYRKEVLEYMKAAQPGWKDLEATTRSGRRVYGSWTSVRLSDGSQIGIGIDVSDRRRMEQNVRRLVKAIEQAGEGILILSPEWIIEYVNPIYEVLTGYSQNELLGRKITDLSLYARESDSWKIIDYVTEHGTAWTGRQKRIRKTGEDMDVNLTVTPVYSHEGSLTNYIAVVRDITREVRMQEQLLQNQKLEAIGTLAGGIAHDLKNILTPIMLNTEIALMDVEEGHPVHELLQEIMQAAKMGTEVVSQVVTFSRRNLQEKRPVKIGQVIREAVDFLRSALPSTISIHQQLSGGDACVLADPTRIKQVMINLGTNAGYAMREKGGELDVRLTRESLEEEEVLKVSPDLSAGPYVLIMVSDTGVGMDEHTQQRIFEPFFTTKKHGEGTGMGLSVVHGIVKEHQGAVTVWSRPGKGSIFSGWLPVFQDDTKTQGRVSVRH